MKYLKMIGLAAVAAAALTAFLGAGTASATVLCETNVTTNCGNSWEVKSGSALTFSAEGSTVLTGPFGETIATCTGSNVAGNTTSTGSSATTVTGNITSLTFTGCNRPVHVNTATTGTLEVHNIAGSDNGTVTSNDTTVTITNVPFLGTCQYLTKNTDIGKVTGSLSAATFDIAASIPSENGCPTGTWEGSYVSTGTKFIVGVS
jgi:hypothetical protein